MKIQMKNITINAVWIKTAELFGKRKDIKIYEDVKKNGMSELYLPRVILYHEKLPVFATGKADNVTLKKEVMAELCSVENAA